MRYKITSNTKNALQLRSHRKHIKDLMLKGSTEDKRESKVLSQDEYQAYKADIDVFTGPLSNRLQLEVLEDKKADIKKADKEDEGGEDPGSNPGESAEIKNIKKQIKALKVELKEVPKDSKKKNKEKRKALTEEIKELQKNLK